METLRILSALAWRNLWRNFRRTSITLVVVSVGLWSILFFNSFMTAWIQSGKDGALGLLTGSGQIHAVGYIDDPSIDFSTSPPSGDLANALATDDIAAWATRLAMPGVVQSEYKTLPITIVGVDPNTEQAVSTIPGKIAEGRYLNGLDDDGIVLGLNLVDRLETGLGRRVILMSTDANEELSERSFEVVGLFDADKGTEDFFAFTGRSVAQNFVALGEEVTQIVVVLKDDATLEASFAALSAAAPNLDTRTWKDLNLLLAATDTSMRTFIGIWLGVVFSLMAIGIINTQLMAVFERTQEFGLLRALGMRPRLLLLLVTIESALLVGSGVLVGVALAVLTIWAMSDGLDLSAFSQALEMFQGAEVLFPTYHFEAMVEYSVLIWGLGVLVALWPARRASKANPVDAMARKT